MSEPFLCKCADGRTCYVKNVRAPGRWGLACEVVAATIAREVFDLPVPHWGLYHLSNALVANCLRDDRSELAAGTVFGSQVVTCTQEFGFTHRARVPESLRARILLFDYWVQNDDRRISESGGNSNLLWEPAA